MLGEDIYAGVADTAEPHTRRSPVTDSSQVGDCARSPPPQDTLLGAWGSGGLAGGRQGCLPSPSPLSSVDAAGLPLDYSFIFSVLSWGWGGRGGGEG